MSKMTPEEIDRAIDKGEELFSLYQYQKLTPAQIDRAINKGEALFSLYNYQKLAPVQIDRAIEIGEELGILYCYQKITPAQIDAAIEKGEELYSLYNWHKLTPVQIDRAMEKGKDLKELYCYHKLTPAQVGRAIEKGERLIVLYSYQKLTPMQINKAMDRGLVLSFLYGKQNLTHAQIDVAIEKGEYLGTIYAHQDFTPAQIDRAIEKGKELNVLYAHQNLTYTQIDRAIEKGKYLYDIYEFQNLTPSQIGRAIEIGEDLDILFSYQTPTSDQIQYAINNNIALEFLYTSPLTSKEQKKTILDKLGVSITEEQMESPLWRSIVPTKLAKATEIFDESVEEKIGERPINDLVGVYPIEETPFDAIRLCLNKKKFYTKEGDIGYGYYTDKSGNERKIRIGKIIKDDPDLLKSYNRLKQVGLAEGALEIVISNDSEDIARKSTGQNWTTCETVGSDFGWPPKCGWRDDIKANNLIAYIREKDQDKWIGRVMIRWCIRDDDKSSDAVIENYYGNTKYAEILRNELIKILRAKGYSGIRGDVLCSTPYSYTGYLDSGSWSNHHIYYYVGDKPIPNTHQTIYHPKLLER